MKKIKSVFAILLLGSLTLSGCAFLDFFKSSEYKEKASSKTSGGEVDPGGGGVVPVVEYYDVDYCLNYGGYTTPKFLEEIEGNEYTFPVLDKSYEREDYDFVGWSLVPSPSSKDHIYKPDEVLKGITDDFVIYANWKIKSFKIKFFDETGKEIGSQTLEYGSIPSNSYTGHEDTDEFDYTFEGWATSQGGTPLESLPEAKGPASYYAVVSSETKSYDISFYDEKGQLIKTDTLKYGAQPACDYAGPEDTVDIDYMFEGWATSPEGEGSPIIPLVKGTANYYAVVSNETKSYDISFYDEKGQLIKTDEFKYNTQPSCDYAGPEDTDEFDYTFEGWATSQGGTPLESLPEVKGSASYYAVVTNETKSYDISFYDGKGQLIRTDALKYGAQPVCDYAGPEDTDEFDYTFEGWATSPQGEASPIIPLVEGTANYYAVVSKETKSYDIAFYDEKGQLIRTDTLKYGVQPSCDYAGPEDTDEFDYTFEGWATSQGGTLLESLPEVKGTANYYAVVSNETKSYGISFYDEKGQFIKTDEFKYNTQPSCDYAGPEDTDEFDYTFEGWATSQGGTPLESLPEVKGSASYFAVVSKETKSYDISFYNEKGQLIKTDTLKYGAQPVCDYAAPEDTDEFDYTFEGWATSPEGEGSPIISLVKGTANYYAAVSSKTKCYHISFYTEDGDYLDTVAFEYGTTPSYDYQPTSTSEHTYVFKGWTDRLGGEVLDTLPSVTKNYSFYAVVQESAESCTITFDTHGGSEVASITEDYGTEVAKPTDPEKDGFIFSGWATDELGENPVEWPYEIKEDITFHAIWEKD